MNKTIDEYLKQPQKDLVIYDCEDCGKHIEKSGKIFRRSKNSNKEITRRKQGI